MPVPSQDPVEDAREMLRCKGRFPPFGSSHRSRTFTPPLLIPRPSHAHHSSLTKLWTCPSRVTWDAKVDLFFGCLGDCPPLSTITFSHKCSTMMTMASSYFFPDVGLVALNIFPSAPRRKMPLTEKSLSFITKKDHFHIYPGPAVG